ncbi:MAG TPA: Asp-tRNA(Asn)/Glu-tRNA(Gln) amidotransferase subunit GatA [bacterium]|nr:Asp-tRNA(Asn)/Glu-tRNA(Gln) amidotransferase subunit GatA [bacterium]
MELFSKKAHELLGMLRVGEIDPEDVITSVFDHIKKNNQEIQSFIMLLEEDAIKRAKELKDADRSLPLYGIPVAVKDNMCMDGINTTCASRILDPYKPPYDATVIKKLKEAGAIIVGKTNMDEFAMGSSTEHSGFFPTHNPWDTERVPGGSSGGSAAAAAASFCSISLGSDTGGSIRQPASFCGVVGMKPTYGSVSRYGLIAFASSLDQIGPFSRDVEDCAMMMNVISGYDSKDSTSVNRAYSDFTEALSTDIKGMKIGVIKEFLGEGISEGVVEKLREAITLLKDMGATIIEIELPIVKYALPVYYIIAPAEASSNLARYDGVQYGMRVEKDDIISMYCSTRKEGFGDEVKRRIMLGTYALSAGYYDAYYLRALKVRSLIVRDIEDAFKKCDLMVTPTAPTTAFKIGEKQADPLSMYMNDICTIPVNLAGIPGISIPCGLSEGMPVGMQFIGPAFSENILLKASYAYERSAGVLECPISGSDR